MTDPLQPSPGRRPAQAEPAPRPVHAHRQHAASTRSSRTRSWVFALVIALSTMVTGLSQSASMVWPGSHGLLSDVAVTVAVSSDNTDTIDLLDYGVSAGHSHGPPIVVDGPRSTQHTYYVLAGNTPVLVHNTCGPGGAAPPSGVSAPAPKNLGQSYGTNATVVPNPGIRIQGFDGSFQQPYHGLNQAINRGVSPQAILDAQRNPIAVVQQTVQGGTRYLYLGRDVTFSIRPDGQVVTVWSAAGNKPFIQQIISDAL